MLEFKKKLASFLMETYPEAYKRVLAREDVLREMAEDRTPFVIPVTEDDFDDPYMIKRMCKEIEELEEDEWRKSIKRDK